ncbi:Protein ECERIFERUM 1 [Vitis vinifera]|uniref:Protein ECERIFERUM 1 n=1 Tax=Vitis vinifera TaxID=29760 RepID=A0A438J053_VITVI|nr:Protein ECERIFERUM 1 [Vitis vinifera]
MASKPGILTDWPWTPLGNFKYVVLAPWAIHAIYSFVVKDEKERDISHFLIFPFLLWRMLHNQLWISLSRHRTAKGNNRIVDKGIEFEQVERERNWALHHHYLYSRYHSHHHSSIVTEPSPDIFCCFQYHLLTMIFTGTSSIVAFVGYISYIDFMNNMGHCNFELVPKWLFSIFPFLKYLMYTPSFHSLHHTQFRTNYSLFMPFYDYIYGTMDKSSDVLYEKSLTRPEESPDVVHLTHLTTPDSIYHMRLGFASVASKPYISKWNHFNKLKLQTWVIPKYRIQYFLKGQNEPINSLIEEAILDADQRGVKVLSLGILNQASYYSFTILGEELNIYGELYIHRNPKLKIKVVDGSSLAVAVVLNSIPKGTTQVLFRGKLSKVAYFTALALCQKGIQVATFHEEEYAKINMKLNTKLGGKLALSKNYAHKIWLVGDGLTEEEQLKAPKGTLFYSLFSFPPKRMRKACFYHTTPAMMSPTIFEDMDSCEVSQ